VEWVLHRSNTAERIRAGVAAGFDRLEMDVWCKRGELRLSHDPSVGRVVLGPNGVALGASSGRRRWLTVVRRVESHLTLPGVAEGIQGLPPFLLDLKGRWPDAGLEQLGALRDGHADAVCSPDPGVVRRYAALRPEVILMYAERQVRGGELQRVGRQARGAERPVVVSARASTLAGPDGGLLHERWRAAGLLVYVWDVPDAGVLRRLIAMGVDGVIVREPAWIREVAA
jgi:glycerophosphoryl diester phosphodiesterase